MSNSLDNCQNSQIGAGGDWLLLEELEPIAAFCPPAGWQSEFVHPDFERLRRAVEMRPQSSCDVVLVILDRGYPLEKSSYQSITGLVSRGPRLLGPAAFDSLGAEVLGNLADRSSFRLSKMECIELNGRAALRIEGLWLTGNRSYIGFLIPGSGQSLREIYYEGCGEEFSTYLEPVCQAIYSLRWCHND